MSFKKMVEEDSDIFFNQDEFSNPHDIDGTQINCIISEKEIQGNSNDYGSSVTYLEKISMPNSEYLKLCQICEYSKGSEINVDGETYIVSNISKSIGQVSLKLESNR